LKEDRRSVVFLLESVDEQDWLIRARPEIYFITDHYRGWPSVLARLSKLSVTECRMRLERALAAQGAPLHCREGSTSREWVSRWTRHLGLVD